MPSPEQIERFLSKLRKYNTLTSHQMYGGVRLDPIKERAIQEEQLTERIMYAKQGGIKPLESKVERSLKQLIERNFGQISQKYFMTPEFARADFIYDLLTKAGYGLRDAAEQLHKHPKDTNVRKRYEERLEEYFILQKKFDAAVHDFFARIAEDAKAKKTNVLPGG